MHGPVRCSETDVHEERLVIGLEMVLTYEPDRVVGNRISVIIFSICHLPGEILWISKGRDECVVTGQCIGVKEAASAMNGAIKTIKAALKRPIVLIGIRLRSDCLCDVPLARQI